MDSLDTTFHRHANDARAASVEKTEAPRRGFLRMPSGGFRRPRWADVRSFGVRWRRPLTAIGILLAGIVGIAGLIMTKPDVPREAKPERVWTVDTTAVARDDHRPTVQALGTLMAGRSSELRPLVSGTVASVSPSLREGGVVKAGETLLTIEALDYELALAERRAQLDEARARLDELRANVEVRRREADRASELFKRGTIAAPRFEETQNAFQAEQARVRGQEAAIQRLQASVRGAETDLARTRLAAPFDGFVGDVRAEVGMRLSASERVATLSGAERMEARVTVPTETYGRLVAGGEELIGRPAEVAWQLGATRMTFPAKVVRVDDKIDTTTGGVALYVELDGNIAGQPIRSGAFVSVAIPDRIYTDVIHLPPTALHGGDTVYVIEDGRLAARKVEVVAAKTDAVFIKSGLTPGDTVVTTRFQEIGPGLKVTVRGAPKADAPKAETTGAEGGK